MQDLSIEVRTFRITVFRTPSISYLSMVIATSGSKTNGKISMKESF